MGNRRTDLTGWVGAVSLLSFEEDHHARNNFVKKINPTREMKLAYDVVGATLEHKTQRYIDTCTQLTTTAIVRMMNMNPTKRLPPPKESIILAQVAKNQAKLIASIRQEDGTRAN